jgi:hypothetical protein
VRREAFRADELTEDEEEEDSRSEFLVSVEDEDWESDCDEELELSSGSCWVLDSSSSCWVTRRWAFLVELRVDLRVNLAGVSLIAI